MGVIIDANRAGFSGYPPRPKSQTLFAPMGVIHNIDLVASRESYAQYCLLKLGVFFVFFLQK